MSQRRTRIWRGKDLIRIKPSKNIKMNKDMLHVVDFTTCYLQRIVYMDDDSKSASIIHRTTHLITSTTSLSKCRPSSPCGLLSTANKCRSSL